MYLMNGCSHITVLNGYQNGSAQQMATINAHNSTNLSGFMFRGAYLPLVTTLAPGISKAI